MLFNSVEFGLFFAGVVAIYYGLVPRGWLRTRKGVLLLASYAFYVSWNPIFVLLLLASTLLDFCLGLAMGRAARSAVRRVLVTVSLMGNLGLLAVFKYGGFLTETVGALLAAEPPEGALWLLHLTVPLGISFYTFQTLSYSIDVYRGERAPERNLLDFALYVSFFPQLLAGPIVRAGELLPQLATLRPPRAEDVERGLARIGAGLFKKVVLADTLAAYVDPVFAAPGDAPGGNVLLAAYAYAFQIYFDFSGYCDIAIGLGVLFGIRLPENFRRPYRAASIREFWQRWHITLSSWLRDYLYIPLGGNRRGATRTAANLMVTMLLGGLWHGAAWHFVVWGGYHGLLLLAHRAWCAGRVAVTPLLPRRMVTFHLVVLGWLLFRLPALEEVGRALGSVASGGFDPSVEALRTLVIVAAACASTLSMAPVALSESFLRWPPWLQGATYAVLAYVLFLTAATSQRFIYFQF